MSIAIYLPWQGSFCSTWPCEGECVNVISKLTRQEEELENVMRGGAHGVSI